MLSASARKTDPVALTRNQVLGDSVWEVPAELGVDHCLRGLTQDRPAYRCSGPSALSSSVSGLTTIPVRATVDSLSRIRITPGDLP